jgi:2-desacetyl-2-hydroxyethyl bacteriochlorophyllide A dehydrogenase
MHSPSLPLAHAYWIEAPGQGSLRQEALHSPSPPGHNLIETWVTGISPGTERLVGLGKVPPACWDTMRCPAMAGSFQLPAKYGYCLIGRAINGPYANRLVFAMHPHQDRVLLPEDSLLPLPKKIPPLRATLIPNLETALNALWDSECQAGERVAIVGGGIVGILVAFLLRTAWGIQPLIVEINPSRRKGIEKLGWGLAVLDPAEAPRESFSLCFHTSGQGSGLQTALDSVGFEGRVIELSWFGEEAVTLDLGGSFHFQRKQLRASQVSTIATPKRAHLTYRQRLERVLHYLENSALDSLISAKIPFKQLPTFMEQLYGGNPEGFSFAILYPPFENTCSL